MSDFITLTCCAKDENVYKGPMYAKVSDIEAYGKYWDRYSQANGFVQVKGVLHYVVEDVDTIHFKVCQAADKALRIAKLETEKQESKEEEKFRKSLIANGGVDAVEAKREMWLDQVIVHDKSGKDVFNTRVYNAFIRHFSRNGQNKVTWRDIRDMNRYENVRCLSCAGVEEAKAFIERKLAEIK